MVDVAAVEASLNTNGDRMALFDAGALMRNQRAANGSK
ncbi:hypothetical protein SAMN05444172_1597 [Burkholderia sp. GAS332]|nr:hypothetical protein SAMN05444172_1597 [Burkholderia sp. GAS332]